MKETDILIIGLGLAGMTAAISAAKNQSSPSLTIVVTLFGHEIFIFDFFNLIKMKYLNVSQIHLQDY